MEAESCYLPSSKCRAKKVRGRTQSKFEGPRARGAVDVNPGPRADAEMQCPTQAVGQEERSKPLLPLPNGPQWIG